MGQTNGLSVNGTEQSLLFRLTATKEGVQSSVPKDDICSCAVSGRRRR